MRTLPLIIFMFFFNAHACELTPEYKDLRNEAWKEIHSPYESCKKSSRSYFFYKAVAKCMEKGGGQNVAGGCFHIVGYQKTHDPADLEHCEIMKPSDEQIIEYFQELVKDRGVQKCVKLVDDVPE